jgi:hypothetical protein
MEQTLEAVLQRLYDSEINVTLTTLWDRGLLTLPVATTPPHTMAWKPGQLPSDGLSGNNRRISTGKRASRPAITPTRLLRPISRS